MAKKDFSKLLYAFSLAWQLGFIIAVPIGGFLLLGLLADDKLHTLPLFLIIGLIVGFTITIYEIYHLFSPLIQTNKKQDAEH